MRLDIVDTDGFLSAQRALSDLVYGATPGGLLELHLAAGQYSGLDLQLDADGADVDVLIVGEPGVWLDRSAMDLSARRVEVRGVGFRGVAKRYAMSVSVRESAVVGDLRFEDLHVQPLSRGSSARGGLILLDALEPDASFTVRDVDVRAVSAPGVALFKIWAQPAARVGAAQINGLSVRDTAAPLVIDVGACDRLTLTQPRVQLAPRARLLRAAHQDVPVALAGGHIVGDDVGGLESVARMAAVGAVFSSRAQAEQPVPGGVELRLDGGAVDAALETGGWTSVR